MASNLLGEFAVPPDHPSLPGHFPGRPIVPGVVLLDSALALLLGEGAAPAALSRVKFLAVVLPGQTIELSAEAKRSGRIDFQATRRGQPVMRGTVTPRCAG